MPGKKGNYVMCNVSEKNKKIMQQESEFITTRYLKK